MGAWPHKGWQSETVTLYFFFVSLGCHLYIKVRKCDTTFLSFKFTYFFSKGREHPYLGYIVLVNDRNLHCHINSLQSVWFDPSGSTVFSNIIFRVRVGMTLTTSQDTQLRPRLSSSPWLNISVLSLNHLLSLKKQR